MSQASKLTLLGTSLFTVGVVVAVHFQQKFERAVCQHYTSIRSCNTFRIPLSNSESNSNLSGHARGCRPRYGTAKNKARETIGLRYAEATGGRVQARADSARLNSSSREKSSESITSWRTLRIKLYYYHTLLSRIPGCTLDLVASMHFIVSAILTLLIC